MNGLFKTNLQLHAKTLLRANGESVSYFSGSNVVRVQSVRGQSTWEEMTATETVVTMKTVDFLFDVSTFRWSDGEPVKPMKGDFIVDDSGSRFEVLKGSDATVANWSDPYKKMIRVHTTQRFEN